MELDTSARAKLPHEQTLKGLQEQAKRRKIKGWAKMRKPELQKALGVAPTTPKSTAKPTAVKATKVRATSASKETPKKTAEKTAKSPSKTKIPAPTDADKDLAKKLNAAVGKPEFDTLMMEFNDKKKWPRTRVVALVREFGGWSTMAKTTTRKAALDRMHGIHKSLVSFRMKQKAMAGKSAA